LQGTYTTSDEWEKLKRNGSSQETSKSSYSSQKNTRGNQADFYFLRLNPTNAMSVDELIAKSLDANGYSGGKARLDFKFTNDIDEAYMMALVLQHETSAGKKVDWNRSKIHTVKGAANGLLVAVFYT
jgi:hypothetical protein